MCKIHIGEKSVGTDKPTYIIAEACDNHLGNMEKAIEMIELAKLAQADAIKFQHHIPDEEMLPNVPISKNFNIPLYDFIKKFALTIDDHEELKNYCEKIGIQYLCTPFSLKAAQELQNINLKAFKIGSGEMTDIPTLIEIAKMGKPMIVSTGMSEIHEIDTTYNALLKYNIPLILLNCVSEYPPNYSDINLDFIKQMIERYPKAIIGHSDHTPTIYTSFAAVSLGAKIIEKHVILDKCQPGPDQSVSIDFYQLKELVNGIRAIEKARGNEKIIHENEKEIREWALRSIVAIKNITKGDFIKDSDIWSKRPGTGIPSNLQNKIVGKRVKKDIKKNELLSWEDIED